MTGQLDLLMFLALVVVIMSGFPVAFSIAGVAVLFACLYQILYYLLVLLFCVDYEGT